MFYSLPLGPTYSSLPPPTPIYVPFPSQLHILKAKQINKQNPSAAHPGLHRETPFPKATTVTSDDGDDDDDDNKKLLKLSKGEHTHTNACTQNCLLLPWMLLYDDKKKRVVY